MQAHGQMQAILSRWACAPQRYRFVFAFVFALALIGAGSIATRVEALVTTIEIWGEPGTEQDVRDIELHGGDVYLSGQKGRINGGGGQGYFCKHVAGGCSSVAAEQGVFVATDPQGMEKYSDAWEMATDGTHLFIASKSKGDSSPIGCPPSGGKTDAWIQSRPLSDLQRIGSCDHPGLDGNDEGLAVKIIDDHIYWGGTRGAPTGGNQYAVLHKQSSKALRGIEATFEFTGAKKLSELFDITYGGGLIFVTGRTDTNFIADICRDSGAVCSGGRGSNTDAWVAALNANLELVWLWQDASRQKSAGQGIAYVDDGSGRAGLVLVGHYAEAVSCSQYAGSPDSGADFYTQGFVSWLPLTGGIFDANRASRTLELYGGDCVGDTFSDVAVNGMEVYAVGTILGPPSECRGNAASGGNHCVRNGFEDAVLVQYTLNPASRSFVPRGAHIYTGSETDSSDVLLTVEHDGQNKLYMGGFTRSRRFGQSFRTGDQDSLIITLTD